MNKTTFNIKGMHCTSCELLIEDELGKIPGVRKVDVSHTDGRAEIYHDCACLNNGDIEQAVGTAGYSLGRNGRLPVFTHEGNAYFQVIMAVGILAVLYLAADLSGLLNIGMRAGGNLGSLPVVFLIGLTAGVSTCMALVGGLVLGASAKFAEKYPHAGPAQKFRPHLFFNLGRIVSYFVLGGVIGLFGSAFQLSPTTLGFMTIAVGLVMMLLGVQLTGISPRLADVKLTLPKRVSRFLGLKSETTGKYSDYRSMALGAATFFLPCGFTQAMQLYAMSTGSPVAGALTMGVFAIGTAPGLLGIGGLTSVVKGAFAQAFFRFVGVAVVGMAIFNIANGYNLTGLGIFDAIGSKPTVVAVAADPNVTMENGKQTVHMTQDANGYHPSDFIVKKGIPVKWIVTSKDPYSCSGSILSQTLGIRQALKEGENVFEFTPKETGSIKFTCSMGMYRGSFTVVDATGTVTNASAVASSPQPVPDDSPATGGGCGGSAGGSCGSSGACGCGGGASKQAAIDSAPAVPAEMQGNVQILKATYTQREDIQPNRFTVQAGKPARLELDVKDDGSGCMGSIMIPKLSKKIEMLTKGQKLTFEFPTDKPGTYPITCAMGVPRGEIVIE